MFKDLPKKVYSTKFMYHYKETMVMITALCTDVNDDNEALNLRFNFKDLQGRIVKVNFDPDEFDRIAVACSERLGSVKDSEMFMNLGYLD